MIYSKFDSSSIFIDKGPYQLMLHVREHHENTAIRDARILLDKDQVKELIEALKDCGE